MTHDWRHCDRCRVYDVPDLTREEAQDIARYHALSDHKGEFHFRGQARRTDGLVSAPEAQADGA